ncbi:hypothetical protein DLAC_06483 [Tieghemostelium lacteum]|uniref:FNIP repeat-containing protein n=1 Tax=Tieghemostelium lacteum TaxID=361077 RepID=A0A151ZF04_TIELA|nr:hypothetical protein DLAC_06483 [Tieghemostelium lacteum]|eukprot:KYQ92497.1 hypothetical protein DLAC_06483 [Tieghemostelium lacteum]
MTIINYFIVNEVIQYLYKNIDILNFIKTNKQSYSFRDSIRFIQYPIDYLCKTQCTNTLPKRFKTLMLKQEHYVVILKSKNNQLGSYLSTQVNLYNIFLCLGFDLALQPQTLPNSAIRMYIHDKFKNEICKGSLPVSLNLLTLGTSFNRGFVADTLPLGLKELNFGIDFNQDLKSCHLWSLESLERLTFGTDFNQVLHRDYLPPNVLELTLGINFNREFDTDSLPVHLQLLTWKSTRSQPLKVGVLPSTLKTLILPFTYDFPFHCDLWPKSLEALQFGKINNLIEPGSLSNGTLKHLTLGYYRHPLSKGTLPDTLTTLILHCDCGSPIQPGVLPTSLQKLQLGTSYNQEILPDSLPPNLLILSLGKSYSHPLSIHAIPSSLQVIHCYHHYKLNLKGLPSECQIKKYVVDQFS